MRTPILISTFIFLTAGCQPNSDGNLLSHNESDLFARESTNSSEGTIKNLQSYPVVKYDQKITDQQSSPQQPTQQGDSQEVKSSRDISAKVFDAVIRLKMDLAGIKTPTAESEALYKLVYNSKDSDGISFYQALKAGKMPIDLQLNTADFVEIRLLAQAFKQSAARYGFDETDQALVFDAILKRSSMLAPLESQRVLAAVNGELLQKRTNELILATSLKFKEFCPALKLFITAGENFYEDKQYTLPSLIKEKIASIKQILNSEISACAKSGLRRTQKNIENVETAVEAVSFDLGSLELYLTPASDFNWEEFKNYPVKAYLKEAKYTGKENLTFSDVVCTVDGKRINLAASVGAEKKPAEFEYGVDGVNPIVMLKSHAQKGVTLAFFAKKIKVTNFKGMTLTKIKPDILVPAVNMVPGQKQEFQLWFIPKSNPVESHLRCIAGEL
ncbi:hypothetical protein ACLVWU_08835 [Bdellovibrio sp. HCB290]|uniref:hypothetical protein n=1 Tax=Bdellovibrio sp. HCB290 TaxID=3394356 RepID=UPI0039B4CFDC